MCGLPTLFVRLKYTQFARSYRMYYGSRQAISAATPTNAVLRASNTSHTAQFLSRRLVNIVYAQGLAWSAVILAQTMPDHHTSCPMKTADHTTTS